MPTILASAYNALATATAEACRELLLRAGSATSTSLTRVQTTAFRSHVAMRMRATAIRDRLVAAHAAWAEGKGGKLRGTWAQFVAQRPGQVLLMVGVLGGVTVGSLAGVSMSVCWGPRICAIETGGVTVD